MFERSAYRAEGLPSPAELALLEPFRGKIPEAAFGEAVVQPTSDGSGRDRKLLGTAARLMADAGWKRDGNLLRNEKGETLAVEILSPSDTQEDVNEKIDALLAAQVPLVWEVDPHRRTVEVHRPGAEPETFNVRQDLSGEPFLSGFRVAVADLFG